MEFGLDHRDGDDEVCEVCEYTECICNHTDCKDCGDIGTITFPHLGEENGNTTTVWCDCPQGQYMAKKAMEASDA